MKKESNKISRGGRGPTDPKKGAVLLIAILVSSVVLAVGFGAYNRAYRELLFASYWKQAQIAFSATDSGQECVTYWVGHSAASVTCFGWDFTTEWQSLADVSFDLPLSDGCATVDITQNTPVAGEATFSIRGRNGACGSTNLRTVENTIVVAYPHP